MLNKGIKPMDPYSKSPNKNLNNNFLHPAYQNNDQKLMPMVASSSNILSTSANAKSSNFVQSSHLLDEFSKPKAIINQKAQNYHQGQNKDARKKEENILSNCPIRRRLRKRVVQN